MGIGLRFDYDGLVCIGVVAIIVFLATSSRRSARRCPRCQEINREAAVYCAQCGTRLPGK
ncbi:MAG: zinc-ribbon domain-containing protein [Phycisphaerales bacterium]|nr:MAG: zinc-ribbon domain-containing protein [Phycisphaerales bacterium]